MLDFIIGGYVLLAVASFVVHAIAGVVSTLRSPKPTARELRKAARDHKQSHLR